jgi:hypothetical protein
VDEGGDWKWMRASEFMPSDPDVFVEPSGSDDIKQGQMGDCWFMSSLAVLTNRDEALAKAVCLTQKFNKEGVYACRFHKNGEEKTILVDDYFPVLDLGRGRIVPALGSSQEPREMWVMLIEKAYAKLHGSYSAIDGGWMENGMVDLTGGVGSRVMIQGDPRTESSLNDGSLFRRLKRYSELGYLMGAGSPTGDDTPEGASANQGIVQGHAFSVHGMLEMSSPDLQLIQLRNPWGRIEWQGDWSDNSDLWKKEGGKKVRAKANYKNKDDGLFWMAWADFIYQFEEVYICRFFPPDEWPHQGSLSGSWSGATAGGCPRFDTFTNNPQYLITSLSSSGSSGEKFEIIINMIQSEGVNRDGTLQVNTLVYNNSGQKVTKKNMSTNGFHANQLVKECDDPYSRFGTRDCTTEFAMPLLRSSYTLIPSAYGQGQENTFTIKWYSKKPVSVVAL